MPERFPVAASLDELLGGAQAHAPLSRLDSLSGATFSQVEIDGRPHVVKHLSEESDWVMRATGDTVFRPL